MAQDNSELTSIEICAGAGGQALGLHAAGFRHAALVEIDEHAAATLSHNILLRSDDWVWQPGWSDKPEPSRVICKDVNAFEPYQEFPKLGRGELDLLAGGVPCPPFSIAGKQLGQDDERDLFPRMLQLVEELLPRAVMIENVRGLLEPEHKFRGYREQILQRLRGAGYVVCGWRVLEAADFGVPQLRPRAILVAIHRDYYRGFDWPDTKDFQTVTVKDALAESMDRRYGASAKGRAAYELWLTEVSKGTVAPTLVGGSKKHGGADLGPTRAKAAWKALGVDALGVANDEEDVDLKRDLYGPNGPKLTVGQAAIIQGFPEEWIFPGRKTARYRQVGNAFPPPVAEAVGRSIAEALARTGDILPDPDGEDPADAPGVLIPFQDVSDASTSRDGVLECSAAG